MKELIPGVYGFSLEKGTLTRGELQRSAANICRFLMASPAFVRMTSGETELDKMLRESCSEEKKAIQNITIVKVSEEAAPIAVEKIDLEKGKTSCFDIQARIRGTYDLKLVMRGTGNNPLAQLSMSIFRDQNLLQTITLKGTDTDWQTYTIPLGLVIHADFYLRIFVAQSGIELKDARIELAEDYEERIRAILKRNIT